jgi:hypothetical protein
VKQKLESIQMVDSNPFGCLQEILEDIAHKESNRVFQPWVQQVQEVIQGNGDYVGL